MAAMIAGAHISTNNGWECSTPPSEPVRWRVVFPRHHCAVSRVRWQSGAEADVVEQTAYAARQEWARRLGLDPEQCEVEVVRP